MDVAVDKAWEHVGSVVGDGARSDGGDDAVGDDDIAVEDATVEGVDNVCKHRIII